MKRTGLALLLALSALTSWAQTAPGVKDVDAERDRLSRERQRIDERFEAEKTSCYQKFAVQDCLEDARKRRRTESDLISRQQAAINDAERKRRGAAALERLEEKKADAPRPDAARPTDRASSPRPPSPDTSEGRERRAAEQAAERARQASEAAEKRREFEAKQRAAAEERASAARRRAEAPIERERYEDKQEKAEAHRADIERRNAQNTKPRSAPLPTPP
ncbi:MAG: hypothetical protein KKC85_21185 [Gammaproteobacteria bacterium]|nr:hypothetical protein [Gammaproteobacteria bacterium]MBU1441403.1 hypothetical protein [Gammaproteobacteria bacterium]MBU2288925.1 hypothetical protein [Gammaproteobacteria bacterium]